MKSNYYTAGKYAVRHLLDIDPTIRTVGDWVHSDVKATGAFADLVGILAGFAAAQHHGDHGDDAAAILEKSGDMATVAIISAHYWPADPDGAVSQAAELAGALMASAQVWQVVECFAEFFASFPATTASHHAHEALQ